MFDQAALPPEQSGDDEERRPPTPVWVDLAKLFPITRPVEPFPQGWDLQARVPGELLAWRRNTTGHLVAEVRFRVRRGDGSGGGIWHTQWVPKAVVSLRFDESARPE
ncbi:hypothetical protein AB0L13_11470 [Saccharopolyspora shandongensis]|uniref:hypothetical protein n=1 Tax=Saccharopolyspora shandongensis TaxID=418495 RepID=UPI003417B679